MTVAQFGLRCNAPCPCSVFIGVAGGSVRVQPAGRAGVRESGSCQVFPTGTDETAQHGGETPLPPCVPGQEEEVSFLTATPSSWRVRTLYRLPRELCSISHPLEQN